LVLVGEKCCFAVATSSLMAPSLFSLY